MLGAPGEAPHTLTRPVGDSLLAILEAIGGLDSGAVTLRVTSANGVPRRIRLGARGTVTFVIRNGRSGEEVWRTPGDASFSSISIQNIARGETLRFRQVWRGIGAPQIADVSAFHVFAHIPLVESPVIIGPALIRAP